MSTTVSYKGNTIATVDNNTKTLETEGKYLEADIVLTDVSQSSPTINSLIVTPTTSQQIFNASGVDGYKPVTVNAMPIGTAGTPTATKGTVSNHSVPVTPSVTNITGYITGSTETGTPVTVTASELASGNKSISANGTGIDVVGYSTVDVAVPQPSGTITISQSGDTDVTNYATASVPTASFYTGEEHEFYTENNVRKWRYRGMTDLDVPEGDTEGWHGHGRQYGDYKVHNAVPSNTTITPTTSAQTIGGANYMMEDAITINAMPSGFATAPATISGTSATVSTGTNTLTLSKTVSVTPSVTAGYVSSGTAGNSSVSLTANITTQAAQTIHPSSSDQTIASGRYLTGAQTIKAVTTTNLTAANIKSGVVVQIGDSTDADCVASVTGTYEGSGGSTKNIQVNSGSNSVRTNGYTSTGHSLTVAKTGTYKVSWTAWRSSSQGTMGTNLHVNSTSGTNQQTWTNTYGQHIVLNNQSYTEGDVLTLYATAGSTSRYCWVAGLTIEEQ